MTINLELVILATQKLERVVGQLPGMIARPVESSLGLFAERVGNEFLLRQFRPVSITFGQLRATDAMPNLIDALGDKDELVRTAANEAILKITKQDFGFAGGEVADKRRQVQDRIRDWWDEHGNEVAERVRDAR